MMLSGLGRAGPREVHRLFFALWPGDAVRAGIAAAAAGLKKDHAPAGRWIKPHRYHLTLHYLGEHAQLPAALVDRARVAGDRVRASAFDFSLDLAGNFANRKIPWWLGCRDMPAGLAALGTALLDALGHRAADAADLVPHVTVLRDAVLALPPTPIAPVTWAVDEFVLIDSVLGAVSRCDVVQRWALTS